MAYPVSDIFRLFSDPFRRLLPALRQNIRSLFYPIPGHQLYHAIEDGNSARVNDILKKNPTVSVLSSDRKDDLLVHAAKQKNANSLYIFKAILNHAIDRHQGNINCTMRAYSARDGRGKPVLTILAGNENADMKYDGTRYFLNTVPNWQLGYQGKAFRINYDGDLRLREIYRNHTYPNLHPPVSTELQLLTNSVLEIGGRG